jgi:hypothetical protein
MAGTTTQRAIEHLKANGYDVFEALPDFANLSDKDLQLWRVKIAAWGTDMRHAWADASSKISRELKRRKIA